MGATTKTDVKPTRFYSLGVHFRAVRLPEVRETLYNGTERKIQDEVCYDFGPAGGEITLKPGQDLLPTGPDGEDEDAIDFLRRNPELNIRFFEDGREPDRMLPTEEDFLNDVLDAVAAKDMDRLDGLRAQEDGTNVEPGHRRPVLLSALDRAAVKVREMREADKGRKTG